MQDANKVNKEAKNTNPGNSFFLDITNDVCPMTFVKTKLMLEKLKEGQIAEVRLKGAEPLRNVPQSVVEHGYQVVSLAPETPEDEGVGIHRLIVKKD